MNKGIISGLLFIVSCTFVSGQENYWSLQKCVQTALENSIDIKIKQLEILRTRKLYTNPLLSLFPTVGLGGNHVYNFGSTIDPNTNNRVSSDIQGDNFYLNANMNLLDFGALAESRKNRAGIELARADKEVIAYEYKLQVLEKYFEALYSQELLGIMKKQFVNTTFNLDRIRKEVEIGNKPKSDLYDMQLAFAQEEKGILETEQQYAVLKMQLFQLMNYENVAIANVVLESQFAEKEEAGDSGFLSNPRIVSAELSYRVSKRDIAVLRSDNLPKLTAFYGFSTFYTYPLNQPGAVADNFNTQFGNNKNHQAGLQLNIPVFNGFNSRRRIAASKIETEKSQWASEQEKQRISQQIQLEKMKKEQYLRIQEQLAGTLKYAEASFKTAQAKFSSGQTEAIIYTSVKNQLLSSEYDLLKNHLQLQYTALKISLLQRNELN